VTLLSQESLSSKIAVLKTKQLSCCKNLRHGHHTSGQLISIILSFKIPFFFYIIIKTKKNNLLCFTIAHLAGRLLEWTTCVAKLKKHRISIMSNLIDILTEAGTFWKLDPLVAYLLNLKYGLYPVVRPTSAELARY